MAIGGVKVKKVSANKSLSLSADNISGIVMNGVAVADKIELGKVYSINGTFDAKALGLNDAYDKANGVLVYYHIREFYRETKLKSGTKLWFMIVPQDVTLSEMIEDVDMIYSHKIINEAKGEIKQLGFAYNPAETMATGGRVAITAIGDDGDTIEVKITVAGKVISLGSYTKTSGETTTALLAANIRAVINEGISNHGFEAGGGTSNVDLTPPSGYGASLNGGAVLTTSIVGTITNTITQFSGGAGYAPTILDGNDSDTYTAALKAQALYDWAVERIMPCQMIVEGKAMTPSAASRDLATLDCDKVTIVVGQDYDLPYIYIQDGSEKKLVRIMPQWFKHAAVGTKLGAVAAREINENTGWVEVGNLTDEKGTPTSFLQAGFSNHTLVKDVKEIWDVLDDKKYIFPITYALSDGYFWNNDYTCAPVLIDDEGNINEHNIRYGRTADKAARAIYVALFNDIKSPQPVDPTTGKLPSGIILHFQGKAERRIDLEMENQISGRKVTVDPNSDLLIAKQLDVYFKVVPYGSTDTILVYVGLAKTI